jgi:hypothetical protein
MDFMKTAFFKIFALIVLISATLSLCCGCNDTPALLYSNFLADLDIITRFDISVRNLRDGKHDFYTTCEIDTLIQDLSTWSGEDEETITINDLLTESTIGMSVCAQCLGQDDPDGASAALGQSNSCYASAKALIIQHNMGAEYV